ncbi:hypothetical protein AVEN_187910-1 [Araneus ventricosus]|uniref:Uncharacterized protein n=1 Tax=Araneus ventricosus TaxID=182803 RepID=A0A4Y2CSF7_ARAVE|nr:hypothetical protein AVEN_187910-1 [Araneus ventricosus]
MDEEDQKITFQKNPPEVLRVFLDWPWHRHFMKLALILFDFLEERDYYFVMWGLWTKIACQWRDYDYIELLEEFWNHSPTHLKEYMRSERKEFMERMINCLKKNYNFHEFY